mmetsp:Transcript_8068/g.14598  ORF Transcript_8068/g.14598 Transcript_8068/m.14598 type:complete len:202 (+) Transcript_8068:1931-2536(+)
MRSSTSPRRTSSTTIVCSSTASAPSSSGLATTQTRTRRPRPSRRRSSMYSPPTTEGMRTLPSWSSRPELSPTCSRSTSSAGTMTTSRRTSSSTPMPRTSTPSRAPSRNARRRLRSSSPPGLAPQTSERPSWATSRRAPPSPTRISRVAKQRVSITPRRRRILAMPTSGPSSAWTGTPSTEWRNGSSRRRRRSTACSKCLWG